KVLLVFDYATGAKKSEHTLGARRPAGNSVRQFLVHPDGGRLLVVTPETIFHVWLSKDAVANVAPEQKKDLPPPISVPNLVKPRPVEPKVVVPNPAKSGQVTKVQGNLDVLSTRKIDNLAVKELRGATSIGPGPNAGALAPCWDADGSNLFRAGAV